MLGILITLTIIWKQEVQGLQAFAFPVITVNPLSVNLTKWSNTLKQFVGKLATNCLNVFDRFVILALKTLTMNIQILGSKESLWVKFKEGICAELHLKLWFESDWYLCNIAKSRWFWKRLSRKKALNYHFLKSLQKQPYVDVLQNRSSKKFRYIHKKTYVLESFLHKSAGLTACSFTWKRLQHRCFLVNVAKFLGRAFFVEHLRWYLLISSS